MRANYFKHRKIHQRANAEQQQQQEETESGSLQSEEQLATVVMSGPQNGLLDGFHVNIYLFWF